ncbi:MAG TPA: type II CAAX endopeptidase family protein [Candidatus Saccharimonadales bacterium]
MRTQTFVVWVQKILYSLAVIASLLLVIDVGAPWLTAQLTMPFRDFLHTLPEVEASIVVYLTVQACIVVGLFLFLRFFATKVSDMGVGRMRHWYLILLTPLTFFMYMLLTFMTSVLVSILFPEYNAGEQQEIGLSPDGGHNLFFTALYLSILVPLAEEFAFRGYLFGLLRKKLSFITVAVVVSLVFALLHMIFDTTSGIAIKQLNVAIDVFILSLFLCYLREKTQSIWASVALHGLKNFIAFLFIFIYNVR